MTSNTTRTKITLKVTVSRFSSIRLSSDSRRFTPEDREDGCEWLIESSHRTGTVRRRFRNRRRTKEDEKNLFASLDHGLNFSIRERAILDIEVPHGLDFCHELGPIFRGNGVHRHVLFQRIQIAGL